MPVTAALDGFRPFLAMLIHRVFSFGTLHLSHARSQDIRHHVQILGQRARLIMERLRDGTLRRHFNRRRPPRQAPGSRNVAWLDPPFPRQKYWLPRLIEETVPMAGVLEQWAACNDLPTLFAQAPQLRRALSPLFTMLGQRLPKAAILAPGENPGTHPGRNPGRAADPPPPGAPAARLAEPPPEAPAAKPFVPPGARWLASLPG